MTTAANFCGLRMIHEVAGDILRSSAQAIALTIYAAISV